MKKIIAFMLSLTMIAVLFAASVNAEDEFDEIVDEPGYVDDTADNYTDIYDDTNSDYDEYDSTDYTETQPEDGYMEEIESVNTNTIKVPDGITVVLDGKIVAFDAAQPRLVDGRTLVPMRKMFESLGAEVTWDESTNTAKAVKGTMSVEISIGNYTMYSSGKAVELDVPAQLIYDRTYVPVRFISEALGAEVAWDEGKQIVYINTAD